MPSTSLQSRQALEVKRVFAAVVPGLLSTALLSTACGHRDIEPCEKLSQTEEYQATMEVCGENFYQTHQPRAGLLAARAARALDRDVEVLEWVDRVIDSSPSHLTAGSAWQLAAGVYERRSESDLEQQALEKALSGFREAKDFSKASLVTYTLFYRSWEKSDYRRALRMAQATYDHARAASDATMEDYATEALYAVLYEVGDLEGASRVLDSVEAALDSEDWLGQVHLLLNRGALDFNRHRLQTARAGFEQGLALADDIEDARVWRSLHLNLVEVAFELEDLELAAHHLEAASTHIEPSENPPSALLFYRARLLQARGFQEQALETAQMALEQSPVPLWTWRLEHLRGLILSSISAEMNPRDETTLEARAKTSAEAEAAHSKAIVILEDLRQNLGLDALKEWILEKERAPYEELVRLLLHDGRTHEALEVIEKAKARAFLDAFVYNAPPATPSNTLAANATERLEGLYALLPTLRASPAVAPQDLSEVLAELGDRVVWIYFSVRGQLHLFTIQDRRIRFFDLGVTEAEVAEAVHHFLAAPDNRELADDLGLALLPDHALPEPNNPLFLSTDGPLGTLPFAALRHRGAFLVNRHDLIYIPSVTALVAIGQNLEQSLLSPAVLGDPLGDLPNAREEAIWVAQRLGVEAQNGALASGAALRDSRGASVLHLAGHTGLGAQGPWLALADGTLQATTLVDDGISARLVVLASCASATRRGKGIWGSLAASFLAAGSKTVVASLWSLDDAQARKFIEEFYRQGGAENPVQALAEAQRRWILTGEPVATWAPYIAIGSGDAAIQMQHERN